MDKTAAKFRRAMRRFRQFGVQCPGGAEALYHWRSTLEEVASTGVMGDLAIIDVDLANCFGSIEWWGVKQAYAGAMPDMLLWENWICAKPARVRLPCGEWHEVDRGAGQGEADGPLKAAMALGMVVENGGRR